jgi:hypothetical protein
MSRRINKAAIDRDLLARTVFVANDCSVPCYEVGQICRTQAEARAFAAGFNQGQIWEEGTAVAGMDGLQQMYEAYAKSEGVDAAQLRIA